MRRTGCEVTVVTLDHVEGAIEVGDRFVPVSRGQECRGVRAENHHRPLVDEVIIRVERGVLNVSVEHLRQADAVHTGETGFVR